jgi:hypothetical protein
MKVFTSNPRINPGDVEWIPKVIDAGGKTVGYMLYDNVVGVNHNGQIILMRIVGDHFDERELYFEDKSCSGTPYIYATNGYGFGWNNLIGFVNSKSIFVTTDSTNDTTLAFVNSVLYSNGDCVELGKEQKNIFQITRRVDTFPEFTTPLKIIHEYQAAPNLPR